MAIHLMEISGVIENIAFYKKNGKTFVRSRPCKYKRTEAMQLRSANFGIAASGGRQLRKLLSGLIPFPENKSIQSKFSGAIYKWIGAREPKSIPTETLIPWISGFQLTDSILFRNRWKAKLEILQPAEGLLQLSIPSFKPTESFTAPRGTVSITVKVAVASVILAEILDGKYIGHEMEFPYDTMETAPLLIDLPMSMERGRLIIIACALQFRVMEGGAAVVDKNPAFLPAEVVEGRFC